jgi:hypothetical protein
MGNTQLSSVEKSKSGEAPIISESALLSRRTSGPIVGRFAMSEKHNRAVETGKFATVAKKTKLMPKFNKIQSREGQSLIIKS